MSEENKTQADANNRVMEALRAAQGKGRWLAVVFSVEEGQPTNKLNMETLTTYDFPTADFLKVLAMQSAEMAAIVDKIAAESRVPKPLPLAPVFSPVPGELSGEIEGEEPPIGEPLPPISEGAGVERSEINQPSYLSKALESDDTTEVVKAIDNVYEEKTPTGEDACEL